jgi:hypothetical protein
MAAAQAILPRMKNPAAGRNTLSGARPLPISAEPTQQQSQVLQGCAIQFLLVEREDGECRVDLAVLLAEFAGLLLNSHAWFHHRPPIPGAKLPTGHIL